MFDTPKSSIAISLLFAEGICVPTASITRPPALERLGLTIMSAGFTLLMEIKQRR